MLTEQVGCGDVQGTLSDESLPRNKTQMEEGSLEVLTSLEQQGTAEPEGNVGRLCLNF